MTAPDVNALDAEAFVRMLEEDEDIERLLLALRSRHTFDMGGPAMSALTRAVTAAQMLRVELRLIRNYLDGAA